MRGVFCAALVPCVTQILVYQSEYGAPTVVAGKDCEL
jgi:hypothetical protein